MMHVFTWAENVDGLLLLSLEVDGVRLPFNIHFVLGRYGDEHKLAGFSATLQAIMSFIENRYC